MAGILVVLALAGCNRSPSANQAAIGNQAAAAKGTAAGKQAPDGNQLADADEAAVEKADKYRTFQQMTLAKFAGRVTVDGRPPKKDCKIFLVLVDPKHLDENSHNTLPKWYTGCDDQGNFAFGVYDTADGAPAGKWVLTFLELHEVQAHAAKKKAPKPGITGVGGGSRNQGFSQPDELKNLYSDPEKNAKDNQFMLDLKPPGKEDYHFDLAVADKVPAKRSPNAVGSLILRK